MPAKITWKPYRSTIAGVKNKLYDNLQQAGAVAKAVVAERVNVRSMSSDELARRGHPYAARHGKPSNLPSPQSAAPTQYVGRSSGALARSLYGAQRGFYYLLEFKNPPRHATFVFEGTRVMVKRTPMEALADQKVQREILKQFAKGGI
jgi:hypothetical protein